MFSPWSHLFAPNREQKHLRQAAAWTLRLSAGGSLHGWWLRAWGRQGGGRRTSCMKSSVYLMKMTMGLAQAWNILWHKAHVLFKWLICPFFPRGFRAGALFLSHTHAEISSDTLLVWLLLAILLGNRKAGACPSTLWFWSTSPEKTMQRQRRRLARRILECFCSEALNTYFLVVFRIKFFSPMELFGVSWLVLSFKIARPLQCVGCWVPSWTMMMRCMRASPCCACCCGSARIWARPAESNLRWKNVVCNVFLKPVS